MKPENLRRWAIPIRHLSDVPVSRNWYKTVIRNFIYMQFLKKVVGLNISYSMYTQPIWKRRYHTYYLLYVNWAENFRMGYP